MIARLLHTNIVFFISISILIFLIFFSVLWHDNFY